MEAYKPSSYVQMFGLDWSPGGVKKITNVLFNVIEKVNAIPGTKKRPPQAQSVITIACPQADPDCEEGDHAFTENFREKGQYDGTLMVFCPDFFSALGSLAELKSAARRPVPANGQMDKQQREVRTLFETPNYQGTRGKS